METEFAAFAERANEVEFTAANLETVPLVRGLFSVAADGLDTVAQFVQSRVFPAHESATPDIGPNLCYAATARAAGHNVSADDVEPKSPPSVTWVTWPRRATSAASRAAARSVPAAGRSA